MIITGELIREAIELVAPTAEAILATEGCTWGPKWVEGRVDVPKLGLTDFRFGKKTEWDSVWGEKRDFVPIAMKKLEVVKRLCKNTSVVVATSPWLLRDGEYLYPGGVYRDGIAAAASGAVGWVDEVLAEMVVSAIIMLANLEADRRKKEGKMQI